MLKINVRGSLTDVPYEINSIKVLGELSVVSLGEPLRLLVHVLIISSLMFQAYMDPFIINVPRISGPHYDRCSLHNWSTPIELTLKLCIRVENALSKSGFGHRDKKIFLVSLESCQFHQFWKSDSLSRFKRKCQILGCSRWKSFWWSFPRIRNRSHFLGQFFFNSSISAISFSELGPGISKRFFASYSWLSLVSQKNKDFSRKWLIRCWSRDIWILSIFDNFRHFGHSKTVSRLQTFQHGDWLVTQEWFARIFRAWILF